MLLNYSTEDLRKQEKIILELGRVEMLSQCSEECSELIQAAQKMRRVLCGTTPVTIEKARSMLEEEAGDVLLLLDCLENAGLLDLEEAKRSAIRKNGDVIKELKLIGICGKMEQRI